MVGNSRYNLSTTSSDYSDVLYFDENGPVTSDADINSAFRKYKMSFVGSSVAAGARLSSGLMDQTMKVGLALNNWTALTPLEQAIEWWGFDWGYGQPPDLSNWIESVVNYNSTFLEWSADNMFVVHQRGFKVIVLGEADIFLRPEQIRFNTTVKNISWSNVGVNISAFNLDGHLYMIEADYAIVTFSIGVLQHDASTLFTPRLPDWKLESIQAFSMSIYPKIFLSFPIKFWNDSQYSLYIDPYSRGRYAVWQDLSLPGFLPDSNIISVTVTDQQSDLVEAQPEEVTKAELMETLGKMYPGVDIAEPNGIFIPRWHSDPLFRGSYSNWPAGYPKALHNQLRAPVGEGRVIFSGEATSYKYYGFLQGAYFEGIRAAEEVLHLLRGGTHIFRTDGVLRGCNGL